VDGGRMKRIVYPKKFDDIWNAFDEAYGKKGSKYNAYKVFQSLKPDDDDVAMIISAITRQKVEKALCKSRGVWTENFQHVERWLKNRRWEDEISESTNGNEAALWGRTSSLAEEAFNTRDENTIEGDYIETDQLELTQG